MRLSKPGQDRFAGRNNKRILDWSTVHVAGTDIAAGALQELDLLASIVNRNHFRLNIRVVEKELVELLE
ncbi:MAG: hypothetical protein BWY75_03515 [bacterium ADurb.Bin425]|nr:MAG: hypothetical protein BWY75_03515 [bacterium ADurb.Bin425]